MLDFNAVVENISNMMYSKQTRMSYTEDLQKVLDLLIECKSSINMPYEDGKTVLQKAIALEKFNKDFDKNFNGLTKELKKQLIEILLIHGADPNIEDKDQQNGYYYAQQRDPDITQLLKFYGKSDFHAPVDTSLDSLKSSAVIDTQYLKPYEETLKTLPNQSPAFKSRPFRYFKESKPSTYCTFLEGEGFISLPEGKNLAEITNKLITSLLYEAKRHQFNSEQCNFLKKLIVKIAPQFENYQENNYKEYIKDREQWSGYYYSEYPSDNSDSDEEEKYKATPVSHKETVKKQSEIFQENAEMGNLKTKISQLVENKKMSFWYNATREKCKSNLAQFTQKNRMIIKHSPNRITAKIENDLLNLNKAVSDGNLVEVAPKLETCFFVAQYRGITYAANRWNTPSRRAHRKQSEINLPQYSASTYAAIDVSLFTQSHLFKDDLLDNQRKIELRNAARKLELILSEMHHNHQPIEFEGYTFNNMAEAMQHFYSNNYKGFHEALSQGKFGAELQEVSSGQNIMVSTGDIPFHALRYAYGIKAYDGEEDKLLKPHWNREGKLERPYIGKVYLSLHPVTDYAHPKVMNLLSMNYKGKVLTKDYIISERETTFQGYLAEGRVFTQHIAKYPKFDKPYKSIYQYKYGLDEELFNYFAQAFKNFAPHTQNRRDAEQLLGEWLCAYHEVWMIETARQEAESKGGILVYQDGKGGFSLHPPTHNDFISKLTSPPVNSTTAIQQALRKELSTKNDLSFESANKEKLAEKVFSLNPNKYPAEELKQLISQLAISDQIQKLLDDELLEACKSDNNLNKINELIKKGANVEAKNKDGYTPLLIAATHGQNQIIQNLVIQHKANLGTKANNNLPILTLASYYGHIQTIELLINSFKVDINQKTLEGHNNALQAALKNDDLSLSVRETVVVLLLKAGIDINALNVDNETALDIAKQKNYDSILQFLANNLQSSSKKL